MIDARWMSKQNSECLKLIVPDNIEPSPQIKEKRFSDKEIGFYDICYKHPFLLSLYTYWKKFK